MTREPIVHAPAYTLAEMRGHARELLRRKPVRLDVELLAQDVLELCERVAALERLESSVRNAALNGESEHIRAWCNLALAAGGFTTERAG